MLTHIKSACIHSTDGVAGDRALSASGMAPSRQGQALSLDVQMSCPTETAAERSWLTWAAAVRVGGLTGALSQRNCCRQKEAGGRGMIGLWARA